MTASRSTPASDPVPSHGPLIASARQARMARTSPRPARHPTCRPVRKSPDERPTCQRGAMFRLSHEKVGHCVSSVIDRLRRDRPSRGMSRWANISKLCQTLFSVALLMALILYPPSSAHAHHAAFAAAVDQDMDAGHHAHAHHDMGDADHMRHLTEADSGTSSDTPNCCQGICMAAVIAQPLSSLPRMQRAGHEATWLSSLSPFDPVAHRRPPKHLI